MHDSYPFEIQWRSVTSTARQVNVFFFFFIIIVNTLHWVNTSVQSPFHDTCIYALLMFPSKLTPIIEWT